MCCLDALPLHPGYEIFTSPENISISNIYLSVVYAFNLLGIALGQAKLFAFNLFSSSSEIASVSMKI